eukprot:gb/GFBE01057245.1/.p1 GENE.gb/GFBE01057245.1/~~gb/GFBE01057245.1/.p1  ORF type:complete len:256 (+),score=41.53 gb/GFBE01057245.1/:1-768(+)
MSRTDALVFMSIRVNGARLKMEFPIEGPDAQLKFFDHVAAGVAVAQEDADTENKKKKLGDGLKGLNRLRETVVMNAFHSPEDMMAPGYGISEKSNEDAAPEAAAQEEAAPSPVDKDAVDTLREQGPGPSVMPPAAPNPPPAGKAVDHRQQRAQAPSNQDQACPQQGPHAPANKSSHPVSRGSWLARLPARMLRMCGRSGAGEVEAVDLHQVVAATPPGPSTDQAMIQRQKGSIPGQGDNRPAIQAAPPVVPGQIN